MTRLFTFGILLSFIHESYSNAPFSAVASCGAERFDPSALACVACLSSQTASKSGLECTTCNVTSGASLNPQTSSCECTAGSALVEFVEQSCVSCPTSHTVVGGNPYECVPCTSPFVISNNTCMCPATHTTTQGGAGCVSSSDASSVLSQHPVATASTLTFFGVIGSGSSTDTFVSGVFEHYFLDAAANCQANRSQESCQTLSNLCVLAMYNTQQSACGMYILIYNAITVVMHSFPDWKEGLPWLYISDSAALAKTTSLNTRIGMYSGGDLGSNPTQILSVVLAKYFLNGTFLGVESLGTQIQLCRSKTGDDLRFLRVGNNYEATCLLELAPYISPSQDTIFYEPYFVDSDGKYFPLSVEVLNYRENGDLVNVLNGEAVQDPAAAKLFRRFFMVDVASGRSNVTGSPSYITVARSVNFRVTMLPESDSRIYPPLLTIEYATQDVTKTTAAMSVSFVVEYESDLSTFFTTAIVFFALSLICALAVSVFEICKKQRRQLAMQIDMMWCARGIVQAAGHTANTLFWLTFVFASYSYVFYKGQSTIYVMVPRESHAVHSAFVGIVVYCFFAKLLHTGMLVWDQVVADIFFIDWEVPRGAQSRPNSNQLERDPVSAWRTLFVANEWNEMQVYRFINTSWLLFLLVFFMRGLNFEYLATAQPQATDLSPTAAPISQILRFCVSVFLILIISFSQWLYGFLIHRRYFTDRVADLVDLVGLANISIVVFDSPLHGWYIHGKTIHQRSDTSLEEINQNIENERRNLCQSRGLEPGKDTFEVFVTAAFRQQYDQIYADVLHSELLQNRNLSSQQNWNQQQAQRPGASRDEAANLLISPPLINARKMLTHFLKSFVERTGPHRWEIRERAGLQSLVESLTDVWKDEISVFYDDARYKFRRVFLCGLEYDLILMACLAYAATDIAFNNTFVSILVTFFVDRFFVWLRGHWGEINLSRKTLVDERFLI